MALPKPPEDWLVARGYMRRNGVRLQPGSPLEREAAAVYAYENHVGRLPPPDHEPGTRAHQQWTFRGGDAAEAAK